MARTLLVRGMLVGLVAGIVAFAVARIVGESAVAQAIAVEGAHAAAHHEAEEPELVSRTVQSTIGLLTATTVFGVALGGVFALVFAFAQGRLGSLGPRALAGVVAIGGFVVLYLVPFLKYAPNPPAVGNPDTIGRRTALYFSMLAISVLLAVLAVLLTRRLLLQTSRWNAITAGVGCYALTVVLAAWALPAVNEVGTDFPATTLYHFRIASVAVQFSLWLTLGLAFGALTEHSLRAPRPARAANLAAHPG